MNENPERKFLHDIASPLGTALFLQDLIVETLEERQGVNQRELTQARQLLEVLRQMKGMVEARRSEVTALATKDSAKAA